MVLVCERLRKMDFRKFSVKRHCLLWQLQLVVSTLLLLAVSSLGSPIETRKTGRSSVFSLFNLKEKSRFWSEDVIHNDFDDLKFSSHGKLSVFNYTNAGNIANYLKLQEVDSIHLPVPMNFIFIGFEGKGSHEFKLLLEEIERWFTKIDHVFEHTRIRHEEVLIPFYKTNMDKMRWHQLPVVSHINYNFSVHAIEMGEKVTSIIEHAINVFGRKDDPVGNRNNNGGGWQVDVDMLDGLLSSLVEYLQLENAYNIFILNPKRDERKPKYGYRRGLSEPEINLLKENKSLQMKLLQAEKASLPSVEKTIGSASEISEEEAEDRLQDAIQEKFAVFGDKEHQAIDILLAEIDIYELFAFKHCKGRKVKLALCEELDERMRDLRNELQSFEGEEYDESHKKKAIEALKRMESWNLFSDTYEEFQNYTVARDSFLAHLGATLWGSMRHIVSPSVVDGAFHYYEKISFQLFFMTQEKVGHIKQLPVDMKAIMDGFSSLMVPSQKPMFSPHVLPLSEDPALAMAFAVARRAAAVPLLLVNGTYRKTVRTYLDSSILQFQLQRLNKHGSLKGSHVHSRSVLEVPVFWFIYSEPLLLDKYFQAKALSDMIIVVQSEPSSWESHLHCNGHSLLLNLRQPIKAAVASTAEHLAGLLPLHLVYGQAHETAVEDWLWSVGCNPFSITSQGWHISQFQSDSIARSYVITTLEESIQLVNSAIHLLLMERTTEKTFRIFQSQEHELVNKYNYVVSLWKRVSTVTGELHYGDALRLLNNLEDASKRFVDQVNVTLALLHPINCTRERKIHMVFDMTTIPAFLIVLGCLFMVLRPRRPKPKIN
ncbi:hypothetical protein AAZV13_08G321400 [Glycine max]